ncbi:MAG: glycosyltransferase, partial [Roseinatronobacter sp.]
ARFLLDPGVDFSTRFYLERSPDVARAGVHPFLHYLKWGKLEGRLPHPAYLPGFPDPEADGPEVTLLRRDFDVEFYEAAHPEIVQCHIDAALHYFHFGWKLDRDPSPHFSTRFYLDSNADVRESDVNPFYHFLRWGRNEGRRGHEKEVRLRNRPDVIAQARLLDEAFDVDFYRRQNPALASNDADPILHYMSVGWRMGLDPSPDFSTKFYVQGQGDRPFVGGNPLSDYVQVGKSQGSLPRPLHQMLRTTAPKLRMFEQKTLLKAHFDAEFYADCNPDLSGGSLDLLEHYILFGWKEGRDPARWFSTRFYRDTYTRAADHDIDPLSHYLIWGKAHGFRPNPSVMPDSGAARGKLAKSVVHDTVLTGIVTDPQAGTRVTQPKPDYTPKSLDIHLVIPDYGVGGGGHMTIFRMVHWLEYFGHRCTIWVKGMSAEETETGYERILKHYQFVRADIRALDEAIFETQGDILFATSWDTAATVRDAKGFKQGCYFIQDYEPMFNARGARAIMAEATYDMGLAAVCASPWLRHLVETRHEGWARHFYLSYDREFYYPPETLDRGNDVPRIALYGRIATERRCVELALLALEELTRRGVQFHVDIFGSDGDFTGLECAMTNHGILSSDELGRLYRAADLGICFSGTNYSLVPQEMMGCALPVVELDVESARFSIPDEAAFFAKPDPMAIADMLEKLLSDPEARRAKAEQGLGWASQHDWEMAARAVENAILERLSDGPWQAHTLAAPAVRDGAAPKASVIVPTLNGGAIYHELLDRLTRQKTDFEFELVVVDSGSRDDTVERTRALPFARVVEIDKSQFQHGRTRNLAAAHAKGEFLLFLTQDALPADNFWLYNFIHSMERFPEAMGAFGAHYAHRDATAFTRMEMRQHFAGFNAHPLLYNKHLDIARWNAPDRGFHQLLHFYSDNNSCMRRSAWEIMPYPEVDYGEDQLWAYDAIKRGWSKLYCPNAIVYHSHDYDYDETLERAEVEAWFFRKYFDYDLEVRDIPREHVQRIAAAERFGRAHNLPREEVEQKKRNGLAQLEGWKLGKRRADAEAG